MNQDLQSAAQTSDLLLDQAISDFFARNIQQAKSIGVHYESLWNELSRLIQSGGKRIRPKITLLSYRVFGGTDVQSIIPIAAAQELLHLSLLIHDDIIDRDFIRYGVQNIAGSYQEKYRNLVEDGADRTHYANSAALLAGDLLISGAYQLISESAVEPRLKQKVQSLFGQAIFEVAGGELLDTESAFRPVDENDALNVALYKTASYSFITPFLIGATLAEAEESDCQQLRKFAENLGIAFQLKDDLLGVFGDEKVTGKSVTSDIIEGKHTFMVEAFLELADTDQLEVFKAGFGVQSATETQISAVRDLFVQSGAQQVVTEKISHYEQLARDAVQKIRLSEDAHNELSAFIKKVLKRDH
jgi:geranylgeranyl diphosphate synthase type II